MKKQIIQLFIFLALVLSACKSNTPVSPESDLSPHFPEGFSINPDYEGSDNTAVNIYMAEKNEAGELIYTIPWSDQETLTTILVFLNEMYEEREKKKVEQSEYIIELLNKNTDGSEYPSDYIKIWFEEERVICFADCFQGSELGPYELTSITKAEFLETIGQ